MQLPLVGNAKLDTAVLIEHLQENLGDSPLEGRTICEKDANCSFMAIVNLYDKSIRLRKNKRIGEVSELRVISQLEEESLCAVMSPSDEIGNLDHIDLEWSSEVPLDHL